MDNAYEIVVAVMAIIGGLSVIARLTKTKVDDKIIAAIAKVGATVVKMWPKPKSGEEDGREADS